MINKDHPLANLSREEENSLAIALKNYTSPNNSSYDPEFDAEIRELRPDWFVTHYDIAQEKKDQILNMARSGEARPHYKNHPLGRVFNHYTSSSTNSYDPEFDAEIRELRPDWFVTPYDIAQEKKDQILDMARSGEPRPNQRNHPLGKALGSYTNPSSKSYDPNFDRIIRRLRPDWFVTQSEKAQEKKDQILDMARNGEARPHNKNHPLGIVLSDYTNSSKRSYDPEFDAELRELRPDWFRKSKRKS